MDAWSVGVVAFELLTGGPAWPRGTKAEAITAELLDDTALLPWERASRGALQALGRVREPVLQCLRRRPADRPTMAQLAATMHHIYLSASTAETTYATAEAAGTESTTQGSHGHRPTQTAAETNFQTAVGTLT